MRIGVDLGGTKIEIVALDADGQELLRRRRPTPPDSYSGIVAAIVDLVAAVENQTGLTGTVGVAIPGAVSLATGQIKNANTTCLIGRPLQEDLSASLQREVRLANDANCFTLSEATDGAGQGAAVVFGVILGTGVGGGISVNGRIISGINAIAGEWGHNPLPWPAANEIPGPDCYCGQRGCIETFLSGPGLVHDYRITTGKTAATADIVAYFNSGEEGALFTMQHYFDRLARALASIINILDPDVIVLGGGLSNIAAIYDCVPSLWHEYIFSDQVDTRLLRNQHGDSSGVRGAAWLWPA
ncbi:MAG TPA: ROK family protein [Gammaproteobacteria bacterium]|nr:ROK family protein [Gammaproteobacteria bacterium]